MTKNLFSEEDNRILRYAQNDMNVLLLGQGQVFVETVGQERRGVKLTARLVLYGTFSATLNGIDHPEH